MCNGRKSGFKSISHQNLGKVLFGGLIIAVIIAAVCGAIGIFHESFRLDQYATTIFGTTSGIVGTMFGLTAASYAFIWSDLRSDRQENRHLGKVLECYSMKLWHLFVCSLILTVLVIFTSLIGLALAQFMTDLSLFKREISGGRLIYSYENTKIVNISVAALLNLSLSAIAIGAMTWMNWAIFKRNAQYADIAEAILNRIENKYNMELPVTDKYNSDSIEYEKIHNLEILVERILKNHESIGDAFAETHRREKLLTAIIINELTATYHVEDTSANVPVSVRRKTEWGHLEEKKRISRWEQCRENADKEYKRLKMIKEQISEAGDNPLKPCESSFISVYDDLLSYRDNSLVWEEKHRKKQGISKRQNTEEQEFIDIFSKRALRYTIKKRLLFFYLRGEIFSNMDLAGISFSGADLRFTDFSGCNLTGIRLKGANCEGADFTGSKMAGMYFSDVTAEDEEEVGEIQLSCMDKICEGDTAWNPYRGEEATCLKDATFKEADVSRAYLKAPEQVIFSLEGTNFDHAKMFFSYFKNVNFTNSSLEKAQMYNVGMVHTKARSANFAKTTLANSCLAWCDFENADFSDASLAETILLGDNFRGAKMENVNFSYSNIIACDFEGASCQNASFKNIIQDLEGLDKRRPKALEGLELNESPRLGFRYTTLTNTDFSGAELDNVLFSNAVGQNCIFTRTTGRRPVFDNAIFNSTVFNTAGFVTGSFKNTALRNSVFTDTQFINCSFYKADFSGALFTEADNPCFMGGLMCEADFSNVNGIKASSFQNICLVRVDFKGTGLRKIDFINNVKIIECKF